MDYKVFYEPDSLADIKGNEAAIAELKRFALSFEMGNKQRPILIYGPTGVGKSAAVHLLAKENNWNLVELNASDYRDKDTIKQVLVTASQTSGLFKKRNVILLDEVDDLSSKFDKGAGAAITELIRESKNPVILIANDMWDQKISFLRNLVSPVEFKKPNALVVEEVLAGAAKKHGLKASREIIATIARRSGGDVRSAINDLIASEGADEDVLDYIGLRDRKGYIFETLDKIFMSNTLSAPIHAITIADDTGDMIIKWIDQNIPKRYQDAKDIYVAYSNLSKASVYYTRAIRAQYYTYWRYMNVMMSSGIALAKSSYPQVRMRYEFPKVIKELSASKGDRLIASEISKKLQKRIHESMSTIKEYYLPMFSAMIKSCKKPEDAMNFFEEYYDLSEKQISFLESYKP